MPGTPVVPCPSPSPCPCSAGRSRQAPRTATAPGRPATRSVPGRSAAPRWACRRRRAPGSPPRPGPPGAGPARCPGSAGGSAGRTTTTYLPPSGGPSRRRTASGGPGRCSRRSLSRHASSSSASRLNVPTPYGFLGERDLPKLGGCEQPRCQPNCGTHAAGWKELTARPGRCSPARLVSSLHQPFLAWNRAPLSLFEKRRHDAGSSRAGR